MPYKDLEKRRAAKRRSAAKRRKAGICSRCPNQRLPRDSRCHACREKQRQAERVARPDDGVGAVAPFDRKLTTEAL